MNELVRKELYHYPEAKHDCESIQDYLWQLVNCIADKQEISMHDKLPLGLGKYPCEQCSYIYKPLFRSLRVGPSGPQIVAIRHRLRILMEPHWSIKLSVRWL